MASVSEWTFGCSVCLREKASSWRTRLAARLAFCLDVHDIGEGRVGRPHLRQQQVGEADDRGQHVVEVMRDARGQLAHCLHLLALRQLRFQRLALGAVEREDNGGRIALAQPREGQLHGTLALVGDHHVGDMKAGLAGQRCGKGALHRGAIVGGDDAAQVGAALGLLRQREEGRIGHAQHALLVDFGNADRRIVDETRQTRRRDGRRFLARHREVARQHQRARRQHAALGIEVDAVKDVDGKGIAGRRAEIEIEGLGHGAARPGRDAGQHARAAVAQHLRQRQAAALRLRRHRGRATAASVALR